MKRTLRMFGNSLGNCIYDKEYLTYAKKFPTKVLILFKFYQLKLIDE